MKMQGWFSPSEFVFAGGETSALRNQALNLPEFVFIFWFLASLSLAPAADAELVLARWWLVSCTAECLEWLPYPLNAKEMRLRLSFLVMFLWHLFFRRSWFLLVVGSIAWISTTQVNDELYKVDNDPCISRILNRK